MIKMMAAICRKPGMTHAQYLADVQHVHGAISSENPVAGRRHGAIESLKPVLLPGDADAVRVRRKLQALVAKEQAA